LNQRERFVQKTFDRIAQRYDLLNRVISFHLDTTWRERAVNALQLKGDERYVLDLGTGTGDLALTAGKAIGERGKVIGLDLSLEMIRLAQRKKTREALDEKISYLVGTALSPPFKRETFDGILTAFVLRNITDLKQFFLSAYRLLKPGAGIVSLEMFPPKKAPFSFFYSLYFYYLVPWIGAGLAHDHQAYRYLADSVKGFCPPESITELLEQAGFTEVKVSAYLCGAVCLHRAVKPHRTLN
jgi:demethylmenaquinone methyltransferase/2-methoxy-6-polyprenyl-1,4-benzoquinol methylase